MSDSQLSKSDDSTDSSEVEIPQYERLLNVDDDPSPFLPNRYMGFEWRNSNGCYTLFNIVRYNTTNKDFLKIPSSANSNIFFVTNYIPVAGTVREPAKDVQAIFGTPPKALEYLENTLRAYIADDNCYRQLCIILRAGYTSIVVPKCYIAASRRGSPIY